MKINKPIGLFKRLISRAIDFFLIAVISIGLLFILAKPHRSGPATFNSPWMFYVWALITILCIGIFMIAIPLATKGWSIGMKIMKIKVVAEQGSIYKAILKREIAFGIAWIVIALLGMAVVNHTLIDSAARVKGYTNPVDHLTNFEKTRMTFVGSISGLIWFIQMWLGITIVPNKDKRGWHDRWAQASVVSSSKKIDKEVEEETRIVEPIVVENNIVEWISTKEK
ncbi:RDD family protein [Mycoplasma todarodis]|uniref:RDD family protein n=1 Tax=Mycoplasma todarodis TaxID=1937191 RepID=UPI003B3114BF